MSSALKRTGQPNLLMGFTMLRLCFFGYLPVRLPKAKDFATLYDKLRRGSCVCKLGGLREPPTCGMVAQANRRLLEFSHIAMG